MVDSMRIHKSTDINIRTLVKIAEMLKIVRDHLKTKAMCDKQLILFSCIKICT